MECARCKGNLLCGKIKCPLLQKFRFLRVIEVGNRIDNPTPPSAFVGRVGYPKVYAGSLVAINPENFESIELLDAPWAWKNNIEEVIKYRVSLIRTTKRLDVNMASNPDYYLMDVQEATASIKPVEVEAEINRINRKLSFDDTMQPMGFNAIVSKFKVMNNPKIPDKVEKVYYDDMKAVDSLKYLKDRGFSTYYLQKLFSIGMLGYRKNRKLVPTRWSITAIDSMVSRRIRDEVVKRSPIINEYRVYEFHDIGTKFVVLMIPEAWSYELIEAWYPGSAWNMSSRSIAIGGDWEDYGGRTKYAEIGGCYYAARLAVCEHLIKEKRQAKVVVLREAHPGYIMPVGVWQVRENVRNALKQPPLKFSSLNEALNYIAGKFDIPIQFWIWKSKLIQSEIFQKKLTDFMINRNS